MTVTIEMINNATGVSVGAQTLVCHPTVSVCLFLTSPLTSKFHKYQLTQCWDVYGAFRGVLCQGCEPAELSRVCKSHAGGVAHTNAGSKIRPSVLPSGLAVLLWLGLFSMAIVFGFKPSLTSIYRGTRSGKIEVSGCERLSLT
jgi:hypothetical protein